MVEVSGSSPDSPTKIPSKNGHLQLKLSGRFCFGSSPLEFISQLLASSG